MQETLLRAMAGLLLAHRRTLYATPGLEGVADHGGERINKKIQGFARRMAGEHAAVVAEELGKMKGRKKAEVKEEPGVEVEQGGARKKRKL
jgi:hypothetical protein